MRNKDKVSVLSNGMSQLLYYLYDLVLRGGRITKCYRTVDGGYSLTVAYRDTPPGQDNVGGIILLPNDIFQNAEKKLWPY
jgi:hypothetical protein